MKKVYFLQTCSTCKKILSQFDFSEFEKQNIKSEMITENQLNEMKNLAGSYESLFSRRAKKYKELGLKNSQLTEEDYKKHILSDYTFLKRPVIIDEDNVFIGSEKNTIENLSKHFG